MKKVFVQRTIKQHHSRGGSEEGQVILRLDRHTKSRSRGSSAS